ncbi:phosphoglycolate phosphatase [Novosphingobium sp. 1529]|uniref:HAD-IA family hydrolase n=1 Tax=unclassified Novosphingobium TaxID=2644732 RepID=UPI0003B70F8B|nr:MULTISPECIES: HAD-IA family hydrolase [unclassified Novosphingobium]KPF52019.1 phosphoglycolate phosphatase [Novosphingobium sp. AAP1]
MTDFPFSIVGFDLDGTLCDTAADLGNALNRTLEYAGRQTFPLDVVRRFIGGGSGQMLRNALAESGGYDEAEFKPLQDRLFAYYGEAIAVHSRLYPGGAEMLDALAARGVTVAVATNKREEFARQLLDELGLSPRFATIIGGDTLGPGKAKPAPDMLEEMIARCGGGRAAFVGDTTFDIGAARAAGLPVVAVSFGFHDLPPPLLGADAVIDHFDALVPTLTALG